MDLYRSRLHQLRFLRGSCTELQAAVDYEAGLMSLATDHMLELSHWDKKRIHNLKYFTWVEQMGKSVDELDRQWNDGTYWNAKFNSRRKWDDRIC